MIFNYKIQYDALNNITGYEYKIITGYTSDDIYTCDIDCTVDCDITCDSSTCTSVCTSTCNGTVDLGPAPIFTTYTLIADGVTDDQPQFQALIDKVNSLGGGTIVLPPSKKILLESMLIVRSNLKLTSKQQTSISAGSGISNTMLSCPITYGSTTTFHPLENFSLENIIFEGDKFSMNVMLNIQSTLTQECKNISIKNCDFMANLAVNNCFLVSHVSGLHVENCTFTNSGVPIRISGQEQNDNITITNCSFLGGDKPSYRINATRVNKLHIEKSVFSNAGIGIGIDGSNTNVYIKDNIFENTLTNNPIRITGSSEYGFYTEHLWITGNQIKIGRATSEIDTTVITRLSDGRAYLNGYDVANKPIGNSAINITCPAWENVELHHENVVIENNIADGPDYGFFDGGSGDLFSLKDIVRLTCTGNRARNSGDLGYAIERCHFAVVSNNTADRNNSCGISVFDSSNVNVVGNVCSDNELTRDGLYTNKPYGGIRVEGDSYNVLVEGNFFFANSTIVRSLVNDLYTNSSAYNTPGIQTQEYGVVVKHSGDRLSVDDNAGIQGDPYQKTPFNIKVGHNHTSTHFWGTLYNKMGATKIVDTYSANTIPLKADYPLGARLRNSLTKTSTLSIKEWYVSHRIELFVKESVDITVDPSNSIKVAARTSIPGNQSSFLDENQQNSNYKYIINDDLTTMQQGDIIGVMLDNYGVHWTKISAVTVNGAEATITLVDNLPDNVSVRDSNSTDPEVANRIVKRVMSLRWETLI